MNTLRKPFFWFTLQLVVTLFVLAVAGGLEYVRHPDTPSYLKAAQAESWTEALSHNRAIGYPLFLRTVTSTGLWLRPVPPIQFLLFFGSLLLFWYAIRRLSGSGWLAWSVVLPMPWAGIMALGSVVLPDFLAGTAAIVAVSCLLMLVAGPARTVWWMGLGVAVFCAYQLRPAAVFLVAFIPLLALALRWLFGEQGMRSQAQWLAAVAAVTLLPFLMFCSWRWIAVGHFGVVSFGGPNQAGMAANFLDPQLVRELPPEHRRLARIILRGRRERGWETMQMSSSAVEHFAQYSDNIWRIALPAAQREYKRMRALPEGDAERIEGMDRPARVVQNEMLSRLSRATVQSRPALYFKWVTSAQVYGLKQLTGYIWIWGPTLLVLFSVPIFLLATRSAEARESDLDPEIFSTLIALLVLGVGYFGAYLVLVSLVSFPFERYFVSLTLFLPSALTAQMFVMWRRVLKPFG